MTGPSEVPSFSFLAPKTWFVTMLPPFAAWRLPSTAPAGPSSGRFTATLVSIGNHFPSVSTVGSIEACRVIAGRRPGSGFAGEECQYGPQRTTQARRAIARRETQLQSRTLFLFAVGRKRQRRVYTVGEDGRAVPAVTVIAPSNVAENHVRR
jgi:hypothetical protein